MVRTAAVANVFFQRFKVLLLATALMLGSCGGGGGSKTPPVTGTYTGHVYLTKITSAHWGGKYSLTCYANGPATMKVFEDGNVLIEHDVDLSSTWWLNGRKATCNDYPFHNMWSAVWSGSVISANYDNLEISGNLGGSIVYVTADSWAMRYVDDNPKYPIQITEAHSFTFSR